MNKITPIINQRKTIKKVLNYIGRQQIWAIMSIILAIVIVPLTLYVPILIGQAIDGTKGGQINYSLISNRLGLVLVLVGLTGILQWVMNMINNQLTYYVVRDIRNEAFRKLQVLPLKYLDSKASGEIVSRVITDVDQFADGLLMGFTQFFTGIMTIIGTLGFMLSLNIWITLVVVLVTPLSLFVASFIAKKSHTMFQLQSKARGEQTALIDEMIGNEKMVKAYQYEEKAIKRFDEVNDRLGEYSLKAIFFSSLTNPATRFVNSVVYAGVAFTGALAILNGKMTVGTWSCFLSYANQYTKPFNEISGVMTELQNALACAKRVFELIEEEPETPDNKDSIEFKEVNGAIQLDNVAFSYVKEKPLIKALNIQVKPGQKIAIVGPTGCGKTTLINLLMRFYEVDEGAILIDGKSISNISRHSLRSKFGMVLQDTWLKKGTIKENILMGKPEATDEELVEAAKLAEAHSFIKRLPKGYDTIIGEDGGILSQGQKQLLCITRVMLSSPSMLILDEATSSIDTRTELKIQKAFNHLMQNRTSFIVAHRLSTIQNADLILVMKDGKVVEQGKHEDLLKEGSFYAEIYNSQFETIKEEIV